MAYQQIQIGLFMLTSIGFLLGVLWYRSNNSWKETQGSLLLLTMMMLSTIFFGFHFLHSARLTVGSGWDLFLSSVSLGVVGIVLYKLCKSFLTQYCQLRHQIRFGGPTIDVLETLDRLEEIKGLDSLQNVIQLERDKMASDKKTT
jgi:vacuolar-type H+-ATPase subunit I/STV1